jgi:carbon monoxide dehydrogenase subunit G
MIKAVINVEAPREHVYSILTDYPQYKKWLPGCESSSLLSSSGNVAETEIVVNSMKKMKMGLRFEAQPSQSLQFRMTSGKELKAYSGSYRLMDAADGKGTVVIAEMEIDAGAMVPKFMVDRVAKKSIDDTGNALRQYAKSLPVKAAAAAAPASPRPGGTKPRRARRLLQVVKTPQGYRVWMAGETYLIPEPRG